MDAIVEFFRSIWGLWLMGLFLFAVFWAYRPRNKDKFEEAAQIPLNDDLPYERDDKSSDANAASAKADKG